MNNCPIGLLCSEVSKNGQSCDNQEYCQNLAKPWELPYKFERMSFVCGKTRERKKVLVVQNFEATYDSFSQEFIELRAYGWAQADPLPYRYYLNDGHYRLEVIRKFNPIFSEFLLPTHQLNSINLNRFRDLDRKLKLHFAPPEILPYEYDLELHYLKILAISIKKSSRNRKSHKHSIEYEYYRSVDLPYNYVYDQENNLGVLLVSQEVYLDGKKIFAPALKLPE